MKYKDKYDFAEKVINKIPFVQNMNIKVSVSEYSISYTALEGKTFIAGGVITSSFMNHLDGIIDGLGYAYDELNKKRKKTKKPKGMVYGVKKKEAYKDKEEDSINTNGNYPQINSY